MKYAIAVQEVLQRIVIVEADNLEKAQSKVKEAYDQQDIVLDSEDLVPDFMTGKSATFSEVDWIDTKDVQEMEVSDFEKRKHT